MSTEKPDGNSPIRRQWTKKTESSYLVLGIVFLSLGVGLYFSDTIAWIPLAVLGITFLVVANGLRTKRKELGTKDPPSH